MLEIKNISKEYHNHLAVDHVSFTIPPKCIFGLLGPNGAGKTSLIRIITGISGADSGSVHLNGKPINGIRHSRIGYLPEERGLYKKMKVGDHLIYLARLKGLSSIEAKRKVIQWMKRLDIATWWNKKIEELSKGMQQKVQFIATVVHDPDLLILDEPFTGLDPINTNLIKSEIQRLRTAGTSIVFSTHRMEQVEEICEEIVLINNGTNVLEGKVSEIKQEFKQHRYLIEYNGNLDPSIEKDYHIVTKEEQCITIRSDNLSSNKLLEDLLFKGLMIVSFHEILPSLNEIFIRKVSSINNE